MRKAWLIAAMTSLLLCGCESYGDLTSDAFDPGSASMSQFTMDSAACQERANADREYRLAGIYGSHAERHEIFNRAYAACMQAAGYSRRDWSPEVPYTVDARPG